MTAHDNNYDGSIHDLLLGISEHTRGIRPNTEDDRRRVEEFKDTFDAALALDIPDEEVERKLLEVKLEAARRAVLRTHQNGDTALQDFVTAAAPKPPGQHGPHWAARTARAVARLLRLSAAALLLTAAPLLLLAPLLAGPLLGWTRALAPVLVEIIAGLLAPLALLTVLRRRGLRERQPTALTDQKLAPGGCGPLDGSPNSIGAAVPIGRRRRALDLAVSATMLVITAPMLTMLAALICLADRGPVLERHRRVGAGGTIFALYEFRTHNRSGNPTRVGQYLTDTDLAGLPRLWNLFRGDVTLLGPPAELPAVASSYPADHRWLFRYRPGIVGFLWDGHPQIPDNLSTGCHALRYYIDIVVPSRASVPRSLYDTVTAREVLRLLTRMLIGARTAPYLTPESTGSAHSRVRTDLSRGVPAAQGSARMVLKVWA